MIKYLLLILAVSLSCKSCEGPTTLFCHMDTIDTKRLSCSATKSECQEHRLSMYLKAEGRNVTTNCTELYDIWFYYDKTEGIGYDKTFIDEYECLKHRQKHMNKNLTPCAIINSD